MHSLSAQCVWLGAEVKESRTHNAPACWEVRMRGGVSAGAWRLHLLTDGTLHAACVETQARVFCYLNTFLASFIALASCFTCRREVYFYVFVLFLNKRPLSPAL